MSDSVTDSTTSTQALSTTTLALTILTTTTSTTQSTQASSSTVPAGAFIAEASNVPSGSAHYFKYGGDDAVLVNVGGEYKAFTRKCTHAGCQLSLEGGVLKCPCHGSQFDPLTGAVVKGPAQEPLTSVDVLVVDDKIYVR